MKYLTTALVLFSLALVGCGKAEEGQGEQPEQGEQAEEQPEEHGAHEAKHGGELVALGDHAAHIEVLHDDGAGTVTVYVYDGAVEPMEPDAAPVFNFVTDEGPQSVTAVATDGAWIFTHEALKDEPQKARFLVKLGGKSYSPDFAHKH